MNKTQRNSFGKLSGGVEEAEQSAAQKRAAADYMADMALQMRNLAKSWNHRTLQALFEIAYYEAFHVANAVDVPEEELAHMELLIRASAGKAEH